MPSALASSPLHFLTALLPSISRLTSGWHGSDPGSQLLVMSIAILQGMSCSPYLPSLHPVGLSFCRIYQLRKTKTNIQILQQNVLLKQKYMVTFLRQHGPEVFHEMRNAYVETLSRVLSSHFRSYLAALERLQVSTSRRSAPCHVIASKPHGAASAHGAQASTTGRRVVPHPSL